MVHVKVPDWNLAAILLTVAGGLFLATGVLSAVSMGATWGEFSAGGARLEYGVWELSVGGSGFAADVDYSDDGFDDSDGSGLLRASGPIMVSGLVLAFVSLVVLETSLFVRGAYLTLSGAIAGSVAFVLLLLALIFLPIGIEQNLSEDGDASASWVAGLYLAVVATTLALAGATLGFVARFLPSSDLS